MHKMILSDFKALKKIALNFKTILFKKFFFSQPPFSFHSLTSPRFVLGKWKMLMFCNFQGNIALSLLSTPLLSSLHTVNNSDYYQQSMPFNVALISITLQDVV